MFSLSGGKESVEIYPNVLILKVLRDINSPSPLVVSQDGLDFVITNIGVHRDVLKGKFHTEVDNDPLNIFTDGFALRHGGGSDKGLATCC